MKIAPFFPLKTDCKLKLAPIDKKKKLKGAKNYDSNKFGTQGQKIDHKKIYDKNLRKVTLAGGCPDYTKGKSSSTLLKRVISIRKLSIQHINKNEDLLKLLMMLKNLKWLSHLELGLNWSFQSLDAKGVAYIQRILKYFPRLKFFSCPAFQNRGSEEILKKTFGLFQKMPNISEVRFEIDPDQHIDPGSLQKFCSSLSANPKLSLQFIVKRSSPFVPPLPPPRNSFGNIIKELQQLQQQIRVFHFGYQSYFTDSSINQLLQFLEMGLPRLESFHLEVILLEDLSLYLPFSQLPQLKVLNLSFQDSDGLTKENFLMLTKSIAGCMSLKELSLNLSQCPNLNDEDLLYLQETFAGLPNLKILTLSLGTSLEKEDKWTSASIDYISQMLPTLQGLSKFTLNLLSCFNIQDSSVQGLIETVSKLPLIKSLDLYCSRTNLTDEAFMKPLQAWEILFSKIETLRLNLWRCTGITGEFLKVLSKMIISNKAKFQNFTLFEALLMFNKIDKEYMQKIEHEFIYGFKKSCLAVSV